MRARRRGRDASPFSEMIRLIFGRKRLRWRSVIQPNMMPKPHLVPLTGGYPRAASAPIRRTLAASRRACASAWFPTTTDFDPVEGELVGSDVHEVALRRSAPEVGDVVVHFPRAGFRVQTA